MVSLGPQNKPLLRRRNTLSNYFQSLLDAMLVMGGMLVTTQILEGYFSMPYIILTLVLLASMALSYDHFGVYRVYNSAISKALTILKAWSVSFAILLIIGFLTKNTSFYSRRVLASMFLLGYFSQLACHIGLFHIQRRFFNSKQASNTLVIGTGHLAEYISERIGSNPWLQQNVVGLVSVSSDVRLNAYEGETQADSIGDISELRSIIEKYDIEIVYIAVPLEVSSLIEQIYFDLLDANIDVHWAPNIFAMSLINHSVREIAGLPIITLSETPLVGTHRMMKMIEDRVLASIAIVLVSPLLIVVSLLIKLESRGPVFFLQPRTGWDGEEFLIWKFRSMYVSEDLAQLEFASGKLAQATQNDPRVTRFGRFLRKSSIDELPQLINVLLGEMSLVGPRPHAVQHNVEYSTKITAYLARHRIKPGITGLAQVNGYRGETPEIELMENRVKYDLEYINNWSLGLDISIMLRTIWSLFKHKAH